MNKKNSIWLLVAVWTLVSCGTVKSTREKPAVALAQSSLTPEQQRKYDYFFLEAMRLKEKKDYASAFGLLQHCLDIHPNAASALYEVSQYYMFLRQVPQGQEALEKAVANAPDNYWYSQGLASLYQQQNELDKAVTLLEQMVVRFPAKQDPLFNLLDLYGRQEKYDEVISTLNRLEKRMGKNEQLSMEKFRIYLQMKDDKKAFQEIESLVQEYPMDMRYQVILGDVYLQNGKKQEAYDVYQKVLAAEPDNPMAIFSMASYYKQTGQEELYQQQLDTLLLNKKVTPDTKVGVMRQMIVENEQADKDSTQIIALFDRIMKQEQDDPQIPMLYAQYLLSKNMESESVPVLEQVVDLDPTNKAARITGNAASIFFAIRPQNWHDLALLVGEENIPKILKGWRRRGHNGVGNPLLSVTDPVTFVGTPFEETELAQNRSYWSCDKWSDYLMSSRMFGEKGNGEDRDALKQQFFNSSLPSCMKPLRKVTFSLMIGFSKRGFNTILKKYGNDERNGPA